MIKKLFLSSAILAGMAGTVQAQQNVAGCVADDMNARAQERFPVQTAENALRWKQTLDASLGKMNLAPFAKTTFTANDTVTTYHIPLVFHIIHDYGPELITDNQIYSIIDQLNVFYNRQNADTSKVVPAFKGLIRGTNSRYIGKVKFVFHLAQKDPLGNPTNGITRQRSFLTLKGGDFGKLGGWAPSSYLNIWVNKYITNIEAAAYAYKPESVDGIPAMGVLDGVMVGWAAAQGASGNINNDNTIAHEIGHSFSLSHPWGNTNNPGIACGDDDIDDTPPTKGHNPTSNRALCERDTFSVMRDTACIYTKASIGKQTFDSVRNVSSMLNNAGLSFDVYSVTYLDSVGFYPAVDSGAAYAIQVTRNGVQTHLFRDTTRVRRGQPQTAKLNFKLDAGRGYVLSFANNPGAYSDTVRNAYTTNIPGALYIMSPDTAVGNVNRFFYRLGLRYGYYKIYDTASYRALYVFDSTNNSMPANHVALPGGGFLVDYPDSANSQNVMDYTYCSFMFTHGQAHQMRLAASSPIASRNNLSSRSNLVRTGIMDANGNFLPRPDVRPTADFSLARFSSQPGNPEAVLVFPSQTGADGRPTQPVYNSADIAYKCTGETFTFTNRSYGDTLSGLAWNFSNGATATYTNTSGLPAVANVTFSQPGWATVSLIASSNAGSDTETRKAVYVADRSNAISPIGYFQDFIPGSDRERWPVFNYYNNSFKWEIDSTVGAYDGHSMAYRTYDYRVNPTTPADLSLPGSTPDGDFDDFFSPPFNLSGLAGGTVNLNFLYAGASRTSLAAETKDSLHIFASTDCGNSWRVVGKMTKADLNNNGVVSVPFKPTGLWNWSYKGFDLSNIVTPSSTEVMFRFRYIPGAQLNTRGMRLGTGNNFYIDRIYVSNNTLGIDEGMIADGGVALAPNPTSGASSLLIKNGNGPVAITVTDITGKVLYRTEALAGTGTTIVEIPASAVAVKGVYLVQVNGKGISNTQKLVVQ